MKSAGRRGSCLSQVVEKKSDDPSSKGDDTTIVVGLKAVDAIEDIRNQEEEAQRQREGNDKKACVEILVTGSLYLVGSTLEAVGWEEGESEGRLITHSRGLEAHKGDTSL